MAYQIPHDLIEQLQISLRNRAKISSYNPHDPSLPNLPPLHQTIAQLDPSPPYLRCKHCKARLLRDLSSFVCVFCGTEQNTEVPPDPVNFKNTIACRWLLDSLGLDGSEMVGRVDLKQSDREKSPEEFPLTDLVDLEIKWPESEKRGLSDEILTPSKSALNLAGVDLDCYFSEEKKDTPSKVFDEPLPLNKQIDGSTSASKNFEGNVDLSLFGNVQSSEAVTGITKHESGDSFSGWEANFKTANSATIRDDSKSVDLFAVSGMDISSSLETLSGHQNKSKSGEIAETVNTSSSTTNDWFQHQDDLWSSSNHETIHTPEQVEQTGASIDGRTVGAADYSPSASVDWFQDDQWQGGSKRKPDDQSDFKDDDSADAWDDFTSSTDVQGPLDSSRKDIFIDVVRKVDEISEIDFFSTTTSKDNNFGNFSQPNSFAEAFPNRNGTSEEKTTEIDFFSTTTSKDSNFGNFSQPNSFSDAFPNPNGTSEETATRPIVSDLSRMSEENGKTGENSEATKESWAASGPHSSSNDVQMVMAKMHDLSFMLESHLAIPPK